MSNHAYLHHKFSFNYGIACTFFTHMFVLTGMPSWVIYHK